MEIFLQFENIMRKEGLSEAAIAAFRHSYGELVGGTAGPIPESTISPVSSLPELETDIRNNVVANPKYLREAVFLKLNGGLGTSMGLDRAKSLLEVKNGETFLDLTAKQVLDMRQRFHCPVKFMLMNSFNTSRDTMNFLSKYPSITSDADMELIQNKVPKIVRDTLAPAVWPTNPQLEWCPPGHGDLYTALYGSGSLDKLLAQGIKYMFVSNSDNLGATLDLDLLTYFAESNAPFLMECCHRSPADKKGGHLAVRNSDNRLVLRESAQCSGEDEKFFQDISRHQYFNTNNLWVRLDRLKEVMDAGGGFVPLPTILNKKPVDPQVDSSVPVYQLETAMGAAIECFSGAIAVAVDRTRFVPVKKCSDLFLLRSDAYIVNDRNCLQVSPLCSSTPLVELDDKYVKLISRLDQMTRLGIPSLVNCKSLRVKGDVWFSSRCIIEGDVSVVNNSSETKVLPPQHYGSGSSVDLTNSPGLGPLKISHMSTSPFNDQKMGTSGLRKKTKVFQQPMYLENFIQASLNALKEEEKIDFSRGDRSLLLGGDGRYFNDEGIHVAMKVAAANGVRRFIIGQHGLFSTPAISAQLRESFPSWKKSFGSFIFTASHNPGGPNEDFGVKYNCANGGPAPEKLTDSIYSHTRKITSVDSCESFPRIDISKCGTHEIVSSDGSQSVFVEVISPVKPHLDLLSTVFDFDFLKSTLFSRSDFLFCYDCLGGVQGPYAHALFCDIFGVPSSHLYNATPSPDFNGHHADPNLVYARGLCEIMRVDVQGQSMGEPVDSQIPPFNFGAACDGDADRNMILGRGFFVSPSDSLAVLVDHADVIPFFRQQGGIKSVARSMPTSAAVDRVAVAKHLHLFETPTGWKYFGNVMDSKDTFDGVDYNPMMCGEESFGTGSNHIREKDGLWAVLAWLTVLAHYNVDPNAPLVTVETIVRNHWKKYGRNFYCRYDYEGVKSEAAHKVMQNLVASFDSLKGRSFGEGYEIASADEFTYFDPIDGSVSRHQGIRVLFQDGSRIVFRLSGTAGSGATIRVYLEKYENSVSGIEQTSSVALDRLVKIALQISQIPELTGFESPTVIT